MCPRNRSEMGQILAFWSRQRRCRARPGLGLGIDAKKIARGGNRWYIDSQPRGKMGIPVQIFE